MKEGIPVIMEKYYKNVFLEGVTVFFRKKRFFVCSVCGYDSLPGPLYDEKGIPDVSLICACCAFQPGYDDDELGYTLESYREEWIQNGTIWFDEKKKPKQWELKKQLKDINFTY